MGQYPTTIPPGWTRSYWIIHVNQVRDYEQTSSLVIHWGDRFINSKSHDNVRVDQWWRTHTHYYYPHTCIIFTRLLAINLYHFYLSRPIHVSFHATCTLVHYALTGVGDVSDWLKNIRGETRRNVECHNSAINQTIGSCNSDVFIHYFRNVDFELTFFNELTKQQHTWTPFKHYHIYIDR